jgi:hypothetical protein
MQTGDILFHAMVGARLTLRHKTGKDLTGCNLAQSAQSSSLGTEGKAVEGDYNKGGIMRWTPELGPGAIL